jgi:hypothetical protein
LVLRTHLRSSFYTRIVSCASLTANAVRLQRIKGGLTIVSIVNAKCPIIPVS